jgi:hypothetical protein
LGSVRDDRQGNKKGRIGGGGLREKIERTLFIAAVGRTDGGVEALRLPA